MHINTASGCKEEALSSYNGDLSGMVEQIMIETPITAARTQADVPLTIDQGNAKVRIGLRDCV
ncbi:MAG TPA: hypothetical protein DHV72_22910 [Serratia grimesii]|uniref:Uncharacterized protein n=1 Tax=Serratia grimesii TaxID=82995 RepID=A0A9C7R2M4_9GAMM|nr:hypothetical protein [Serratia grimesii]